MSKEDLETFYKLTVTVLRAEIHQSYDYWSLSDCYVIVKLPTSSACSHRTRTVNNCHTPAWDETFHFRLSSNIKHVLEIYLYDEDPINPDDLCSLLMFDISSLTPGEKMIKEFIINEKTEDKLWIEFLLEKSSESPENYLTNGVLVAAPFSTLAITAKQLGSAIENLKLKLKGAYEEDLVLTPEQQGSTCYYINRDLHTEISLQGDHAIQPVKFSPDAVDPVTKKQQLQVSVGKDLVDLELKTDERPAEEIVVRMDFNIPDVEKEFLKKRTKVVGQALQTLLGLKSPPKKVPMVGAVYSGGGTRAMTGTFGSMMALQTLGLLDTISYITGVSGSTWAMSSLYQNSDWSHMDMTKVTEPIKHEMIERHKTMMSTEKLRYYRREMAEKEKSGIPSCCVDMWGLAVEHLIHGKLWNKTLSDQRASVSKGQNPLPIYTAVNMKTSLKGSIKDAEVVEFSPYEVGLPKYGAFIPTELYGSEFYLGHIVKKNHEVRLPFLIGIWSSAFAVSLSDVWSFATGSKPDWVPGDVTHIENDDQPSSPETLIVKPSNDTAVMISSFFSSRPFSTQIYNFIRGLALHADYRKSIGFVEDKDAHPDAFPNRLTPSDPTLNLVDSGLDCNISIPPLLRECRNIDLILVFSYSWDKDQFMVLKKSVQYCTDHQIPFPNINFSELEQKPLEEVYLFEDKDNPKAPIVVHFPMVNITFKEFSAPGVKREGEEDMKRGNLDVSTPASPYRTRNLAYQPEDFQNLMDLSYYNVLNNEGTLLKALRLALDRKSSKR